MLKVIIALLFLNTTASELSDILCTLTSLRSQSDMVPRSASVFNTSPIPRPTQTVHVNLLSGKRFDVLIPIQPCAIYI